MALDERFEVLVNGRPYTAIFGMPSGVEEAVIGSLVRDGLLKRPGDLGGLRIRVDHEGRRVDVEIEGVSEARSVYVEDCSILAERGVAVRSDLRVRWEEILRIFSDFNERTSSVSVGIASHTSGLYDLRNKRALIVHDTSRHTSILKLIGLGVKEGVSFGESVAITTGRASSDMVITLARAGVPVAISMRGPLYSGVRAALALGVTLIANLRRGEKIRGLVPLTHLKRIENPPRKAALGPPDDLSSVLGGPVAREG